jgi:hypothetical protein
MDREHDKSKLAAAILAFDLILDDMLECLDTGKEFHPAAHILMEALTGQMSFVPHIPPLKQEYVLNMAAIGSLVRLITLSMDVGAQNIRSVIEMQKEKLEMLRKIDFRRAQEQSLH